MKIMGTAIYACLLTSSVEGDQNSLFQGSPNLDDFGYGVTFTGHGTDTTTGPTVIAIPFGCGERCIAGSITPGPVLLPVGNLIQTAFDMSLPNAQLIQYWYRDPLNFTTCGDLFNLSCAL